MPLKFYPLYTLTLVIAPYLMRIEESKEHENNFPVNMTELAPLSETALLLRALDPKKRKALELFQQFATVTAAQIGQLFDFKPRTSAQLCQNWVAEGFLVVVNPSSKKRSYALAPRYDVLVAVK